MARWYAPAAPPWAKQRTYRNRFLRGVAGSNLDIPRCPPPDPPKFSNSSTSGAAGAKEFAHGMG